MPGERILTQSRKIARPQREHINIIHGLLKKKLASWHLFGLCVENLTSRLTQPDPEFPSGSEDLDSKYYRPPEPTPANSRR